MKFLMIVLKNLRRSPMRTILTALGTMVLVFVITLIWSVLHFLDEVTREKSSNLKAIVTERWQMPSQMPFSYGERLADGAAREPGDVRPTDTMNWQFYGGSIDPSKMAREFMVFAFAMDPTKLTTMMDDLDNLPPAEDAELKGYIAKMVENRRGIIIGKEKLASIEKRVGERIKITSMNFKGIDLEFDIVGTFPDGRYNQSAVMNAAYLNDAVDQYPLNNGGKTHPMAGKSLNLVWLRVPNTEQYNKMAMQIERGGFSDPAVKVETASSGVGAFLEAYRDLIWGMRWLLAPAILVTMSLISANAISISVRERRLEMAVLKVLGFRPMHVMGLVLAESVLVGTLAGTISALATYFVINDVFDGLKFPIAFFPAFKIPTVGLVWGVLIGLFTSLAGSLAPAWSARSVRVADVFSKVA